MKGTEADGKETYDRLTSELAEAEKELEDAKEEVNSLTSEKNDLTAKLKGTEDDAKEEYDRVTSELAEAEKELEDAKEEVNSLTSEKNDLTAKLKGTEDDAKEEYDRVTSELAEAEKELEDAKEEVNSLTSEKNDLTVTTQVTIKKLREGGSEQKNNGVKDFESKKLAADNAAAATQVTINNLKTQVEDFESKKLAAQNAAKMVRFGSITADPGEVLDAIGPNGSGATVPITLKKVGEKGQLKLGAFGKDLDETGLHLPGIDGFVGTEFERELKPDDGGTTKIRAVAWSDVKTLSKQGDAPLYSGGAMATKSWDWEKVKSEQSWYRDAGDSESQYVVEQGTPVKGTYDDVLGVFTCEQPDVFCSGGGKAARVGVIKFTPKADYLSFGAWMSKPNAKGGQPSSPVVGVFAMGGPAFDFSDQTNKNPESATYTGGATGFYAKRKVGTDADASAGSYTADVNLWAYFENEFKVSGEVTNFQDMRNGMHLKWVVDLDDTVYDIETSSGPFKGTTSGTVNDEENLSGDWEVKFYGKNAPSSAAGTFNARTGTLDKKMSGDQGFLGIVGAFGAKKVMPQPLAP